MVRVGRLGASDRGHHLHSKGTQNLQSFSLPNTVVFFFMGKKSVV